MPFSVKVVLTIVFQNLKTICPKKILFLRKWLKWLIFSSFAKISRTRIFFENRALSVLSPYDALTSCKKAKKSLEPFLRSGAD
jgi:hypothetical protein